MNAWEHQPSYHDDLDASYTSLVNEHVAADRSAIPGSEDAILAAQKAIFYLLVRLAPAAPQYLDRHQSPSDPKDRRASWLDLLRFLDGTLLLPDLEGLIIALAELDRGATDQAFVAKVGGRRGNLATTNLLQLKSFAVEAADELYRNRSCVEEYRARLKDCGTAHATVEGFRKAVLAGAPELHPRTSYILAWGNEPPEQVLLRVIQALRTAEKV